MNKFSSRVAAVAVAGALTLGMSGCSMFGKDAPKAADAWNKTQDRFGQYKSLKMTAKGTQDGKAITAEAFGDVEGKSSQMDISMDGAKATLLTAGGKHYMKGDKAYYDKLVKEGSSSSSSDTMSSMYDKMADKWIETGKASSDSSFFKDMKKDIQDDSDEVNKKLLSDKATVEEDSVDGKDAWKITSEDKKAIAWVSADDKYDLLKLSGVDFSSSSGTDSSKSKLNEATFSDVDKDFGIKAPSDAKSMTDLIFGK